MSTSTEPYTAVAAQAREATEKSARAFQRGVQQFTDQANVVAKLPVFDLTEPVARYFEYVQRTVDLNRDLATRWAELVTSLSGTVREQAEKVGGIARDQANAVSDLAVKQAEKNEDLANQQAAQLEEAKKEEARLVRSAERAEAKRAKEQAREPYEGLTKAELSDLLAERDLPKTGTVEELIERLVSADTE